MNPQENEQDETARGRRCLTCAFWDVRIRRTNRIADSVARCLLPELQTFTLVVSGSSGCDRWSPHDSEASIFRQVDVLTAEDLAADPTRAD